MSRLRLLKVVVQPVFVLDDGETLAERTAEPVTINAADVGTLPAWIEAQRQRAESALGVTSEE